MLWAAEPAAGNTSPLDNDDVGGGRPEGGLLYRALEGHTDLATPWALAKVVFSCLCARVCVGRVQVGGG